jgi:hypothetical protein
MVIFIPGIPFRSLHRRTTLARRQNKQCNGAQRARKRSFFQVESPEKDLALRRLHIQSAV